MRKKHCNVEVFDNNKNYVNANNYVNNKNKSNNNNNDKYRMGMVILSFTIKDMRDDDNRNSVNANNNNNVNKQ